MSRGGAFLLVRRGFAAPLVVFCTDFASPWPRARRFVTLLNEPAVHYWRCTAANSPTTTLAVGQAGPEIARGDHAHVLRVGIRVLETDRTTAALPVERGMSLLPSDGAPALQQGRPPALVCPRARLLFACAV